VRRFLVGALNIQTQGAAAPLTKHELCSNTKQLPNSWWWFHNISADYHNFTDHSVGLRRTFPTQNQIINQVNIFFSADISWSAATC